MGQMESVRRPAAVLLLLAAVAACAKTPPRVPAPETALTMPDPPPHVLIPVVFLEPVEVTPPEPDPPATAASATRPRNTTPRNTDRPAPASPPVEPAATQPVLQTTANVGDQQARIRKDLAEAESNLKRLNRNDLGSSARAHYDQVWGFIRQARAAEKIRNYRYAEELARKAAAVAGQLVKG
jgi:hypothetical protein